jgi:hypothetical protein
MAFSTLTCSNALLWNSFSPIALIAVDYFKTSPTAIDAMSLLFLLIYIPGAFVGSYSYSKLGLKKGVRRLLTQILYSTSYLSDYDRRRLKYCGIMA